MSLTPQQSQQLHSAIARHLSAIGDLFKDPQITLLIRNPDAVDGDVVMTSEKDLTVVIASLEKTWART